jgi:quercetin dioxygenase-like cupin family protein
LRRIVTGFEDDGEPIVLIDDSPPAAVDTEQARAWELWIAADTPPDLRGRVDPTAAPWALEPPGPRGSLFRLIEFLPGGSSGMHSTASLDYVVILSGEITLSTGGETYLLGPGDVVVQRGAPHDWTNHGSESCFAAAILISAEAVPPSAPG